VPNLSNFTVLLSLSFSGSNTSSCNTNHGKREFQPAPVPHVSVIIIAPVSHPSAEWQSGDPPTVSTGTSTRPTDKIPPLFRISTSPSPQDPEPPQSPSRDDGPVPPIHLWTINNIPSDRLSNVSSVSLSPSPSFNANDLPIVKPSSDSKPHDLISVSSSESPPISPRRVVVLRSATSSPASDFNSMFPFHP